MQQSQHQSLETADLFQQTMEDLLDIGEGRETIHNILDDFHLAYLQESLKCPSEDDVNYCFLFFELSRLIRLADNADLVQRTIKEILEIRESMEDVYGMLDNVFSAYVRDSHDYAPDMGSMAEHFYVYSNLQKLLRTAESLGNNQS